MGSCGMGVLFPEFWVLGGQGGFTGVGWATGGITCAGRVLEEEVKCEYMRQCSPPSPNWHLPWV